MLIAAALATISALTMGLEPPKRAPYPPLPPLPSEPVASSPPAPPAPPTPPPPPPTAPKAPSVAAKPVAPAASVAAGAKAPEIAFKPVIIATERPGFSDTTNMAPVGRLILETGYTFTFRDRSGVETTTHNAPEVLARIGILEDRLEIRVGSPGYIWTHSDSGGQGSSANGFGDVTTGIKVKLFDQDKAFPRLAFEAVTTISGGGRRVSNRSVEPTFKLIASWDLGKGFTLTTNGVLTYANNNGDRFIQGAGSASLSYAVNDKLSVFAEYFVVGPRAKGTDAAHSMDTGVAYLIDPKIQLDARIGAGINNQADNFFVGAGISVLF